ncbi:hypothetical protein TD95_003176 [Thielaviopsis punctulata]|uniref:Ribosome production factor 2 homolog n=1 Tax=Thielaviopsis punctulata TaxID=72032 RepID=A0A0F4ZAE0_9PEZI|nr:hypothetical protein TD95_003176 [Thielaviopsis punctulata]
MSMLRQIKPRNARSKRALEKREPKAVENPKTALFLRGTSCSQIVQDAMNDLYALRQPFAKKFSKKNAVHPFEDASSLEFFADKNDASLMVFGSSNKKRPHALTLVRMFNYHVLDMLELLLDPTSFRTLAQFKNNKFAVGLRPMLVFAGSAFENPVDRVYTHAKNILTDFFACRDTTDKMDVEGLQYIIQIAAEEPTENEGAEGVPRTSRIFLRAYTLRTVRSGQKLPRVEVTEIGPRMDFRIGRVREAEEAIMKEALKKARTTEERVKKNISTDEMGDKIGRIHLGRQDLGQLQTRKMKGLKRSRDQGPKEDDLDMDVVSDDEASKKQKTA